MTLCIALNFEKYAILAADTRLTFGDPPIGYDDNQMKIQKTDIGLITGAGLHELLVAVKNRYAMSLMNSANDTYKIIEEERARILENARSDRTAVDRWLERTGWFFTYETDVEGIPALRVAIIHGSMKMIEDQVCVVPPNECFIIPPGNASDDKYHEYSDYLTSNLRSLPPVSDASAHASYHVQLCYKLICRASREFPSVGPYMNYGLHILGGDVRVSERFPATMAAPAWPDHSER